MEYECWSVPAREPSCLTSDGTRKEWDVSGPHFPGWEVYHVAGSPADPNRLYAAPSGGWFGQVIQRSDDGGLTWEPQGSKLIYEGEVGPHQWYDGTPRPWEFTRVWHLEPSLTDPDTVYAGVEDAALFRSVDGAQTWQELPGLRRHSTSADWQPGAGGMCLHTIILDPSDPARMYAGISAAGAFRSDDAGELVAADQPWPEVRGHPGPGRRGGALRAPHRHAPGPAGGAVHAEALGRHAQRRRRRIVARDQWEPADGLRVPDRHPRERTGHHLRRADHQRLPPLRDGREAPGVPEPDRRQRMGGAHGGTAAAALLRQRAA